MAPLGRPRLAAIAERPTPVISGCTFDDLRSNRDPATNFISPISLIAPNSDPKGAYRKDDLAYSEVSKCSLPYLLTYLQ